MKFLKLKIFFAIFFLSFLASHLFAQQTTILKSTDKDIIFIINDRLEIRQILYNDEQDNKTDFFFNKLKKIPKDSDEITKFIFFHEEQKGFLNQFVDKLKNKLSKNKYIVYDERDNVIYYNIDLNQNTNDDNHKMMLHASLSALGDTLKRTPLGKDIAAMVQNLSRYFIVEYSKGINDKTGNFYMPGELSTEKIKGPKEYFVSLSSSVSSSSDFYQGLYFVGLKMGYNEMVADMAYAIDDDEFVLNLVNTELLDYFDADIGVCQKYKNNDGEFASMLEVSFPF